MTKTRWAHLHAGKWWGIRRQTYYAAGERGHWRIVALQRHPGPRHAGLPRGWKPCPDVPCPAGTFTKLASLRDALFEFLNPTFIEEEVIQEDKTPTNQGASSVGTMFGETPLVEEFEAEVEDVRPPSPPTDKETES